MKIAILHFTLPPTVGGVERLIQEQALSLMELGFEVTLFSDSALFRQWLGDQSSHSKIAILVHNVMTMPFHPEWTAELETLAQAHQTFTWINWVHDVAWANPAYAHLNWESASYQPLRRAPLGFRHVAVSEARRLDYAQACAVEVEKIHVVPNGFQMSSTLGLSARLRSLPWEKAPLMLLHPTRFVRRKNIELGIHLVAELARLGLETHLLITGAPDPHQKDGHSYYRELCALVEELSMGQQIHFLGENGALDDAEIRALYLSADALFFPSRGEGFGLPLIEAQAYRLPILCSDLPVHREVLGEGGLYFPPEGSGAELATLVFAWHRGSTGSRQRQKLWSVYHLPHILKKHLLPLLT